LKHRAARLATRKRDGTTVALAQRMTIRRPACASLLVLLVVGLAALGACSSDDGTTDGTAGAVSTAGKSSGGTSAGGTTSGGTTSGGVSATAGSAGKATSGGSSSGGTTTDAGGAGGEPSSGGAAGAGDCGEYGEPCCDRERPCLGRLSCLTNEQTGEKECGVLANAKQ
jgi:hypothetical protein